jgi:hypothetical protein
MLTFSAQHSLTLLLVVIDISVTFETATAIYAERRVWR